MSDKKTIWDAAQVRDKLVSGISGLSASQGFSRAVIGISGGKDSAVAAALCARALGPENVYGVMLPDGEQKDIGDSLKVCKHLGINYRTINIKNMHSALLNEVIQRQITQKKEFQIMFSRDAIINIDPRLRMTVLRYVTQSLGARLVGTGNLSESVVGYCTKDGDTSCDFSVLGALTSVEVVRVGLTMSELPKSIVKKVPSDGLCGMSDEEKLGISYDDIHYYIREGTCGDPHVDSAIAELERKNKHKRYPPVVINPFLKGDE